MLAIVREAAAHARLGRFVVVVSSARTASSMLDLHSDADVARVYRVHGRERVEFRSGGRVVPVRSLDGLRGRSPDVVVVDAGGVFDTDDARAEASAATASTGGYLVAVHG